MVSSVTIPGIGSGIDASRLARSVFDQASLPADIHRQSIDTIASENNSLDRLRTLLLDLADKLDALRSTNGGAVQTSALSQDENVVVAVSDSSAEIGSFSIEVKTLAASASGSFGRSFASSDETLLGDAKQSGTLRFSVGLAEEAKDFSVSVGPSTSAEDFVANFNTQADGVASARLLNLGTEDVADYRIVFSGEDLGVSKGSVSLEAGNDALLGQEVLGGVSIEQATNAEFSVSGVAGVFERDTNTIDGVLKGVTLTLKNEGTTQVQVEQKPGVTAEQIQSFVSSFNALASFVNSEDAVEVVERNGELENSFGSLSSTSVDDNAISALRQALLESRSEDGSVSLAALGVSTELDGTLSFDSDKFDTVSEQHPEQSAEAVMALADAVTGVQGVVHQYTGYGMLIDQVEQGNQNEVADLGEAIERVERSASAKEDVILNQFTNLEGLLARLNMESTYIAGLLQF